MPHSHPNHSILGTFSRMLLCLYVTYLLIHDHCNPRCERHACVNYDTYFLVRVGFIVSTTGRSMWLTLFDQCMASLLDFKANDVSVMDNTVQTYNRNTLKGTGVSLTTKKSQRNRYINYNVTQLYVLHFQELFPQRDATC